MTKELPKVLYVFVQYGLYSGEFWYRDDITSVWLTPLEMAEACRKLTKTMLSLKLAEPYLSSLKTFIDVSYCGISEPLLVRALIDRLAQDEDRSITWPNYPDPTGYSARNRYYKTQS